MDKNKTKKTETFASIFGDDYDETPLSKDEGVSTLKVEQLVSFQTIHSSYMKVRGLMKWLRALRFLE